MTDHIIKAAKEAGGTTYTNRHCPGETACAFGPEALRAFWGIAYRQGLEDAAKFCTDEGLYCTAHDIRALMKETP